MSNFDFAGFFFAVLGDTLLAVAFLAGAFLVVLAAVFFAAAFLAGAFLVVLAAAFLAVFFAAVFFAAAFLVLLAGAFFAAVFFAFDGVDFFEAIPKVPSDHCRLSRNRFKKPLPVNPPDYTAQMEECADPSEKLSPHRNVLLNRTCGT